MDQDVCLKIVLGFPHGFGFGPGCRWQDSITPSELYWVLPRRDFIPFSSRPAKCVATRVPTNPSTNLPYHVESNRLAPDGRFCDRPDPAGSVRAGSVLLESRGQPWDRADAPSLELPRRANRKGQRPACFRLPRAMEPCTRDTPQTTCRNARPAPAGVTPEPTSCGHDRDARARGPYRGKDPLPIESRALRHREPLSAQADR